MLTPSHANVFLGENYFSGRDYWEGKYWMVKLSENIRYNNNVFFFHNLESKKRDQLYCPF